MTTFDTNETETTIGARFATVAAAFPDREAISDPEGSWTYRELEDLTQGQASRLAAFEVGPGDVVAVMVPNGKLHVAWVLATLRAGAIYASLDPTYPDNRLRLMLELARPTVVVAPPDLRDRAHALGKVTILDPGLDTTAPDTAGNTLHDATPESFACLYFTSGSTGIPKAVVHTHRNLRFDLNRQERDLAITPEDRFDLLFSPSFSAFLSPVFGALLAGASVHVLDLRAHSVEFLRRWLREKRISLCTIGVSTLRRLAAACPEGHDLPDLRLLSVGAEPLLPADLAAVRARVSRGCIVQNAFATTETRTVAQAFFRPWDPIPEVVTLGGPVEGKHLDLVDDRGHSVPLGTPGELVVTSRFISPGTWERFRAFPQGRLPTLEDRVHRTGDRCVLTTDGTLLHLGRTDQQLKVRGHRIDAGEVESHLLAHPGVASAAAFVGIGSPAETEASMLVAAWTRRPGSGVSVEDLHATLALHLPSYAIPGIFWEVEALPHTESGKLARRRLPGLWADHRRSSPAEAGAAAVPVDPVGDLWRSVLGVERCTEDADFFALGGDSMAVALLAEGASRLLGRTVPASALVGGGSLRRFRELLASRPDESRAVEGLVIRPLGNPAPVALPVRIPLVLLPPWGHSVVLFRDLAAHAASRRDLHAIEGTGPRGEVTPEAHTLGEMAHRTARAIRERFGSGPVDLAGFSSGGLVAVEVANLLHLAGTSVGRVHLLDASRLHGALEGSEHRYRAMTESWTGRVLLSLRALLDPKGPPRAPLLHRLLLAKPLSLIHAASPSAPHDPYLAAYEANVAMSANHRVLPCPCPVTLHRCDDQDQWYNLLSPDLGWSSACPAGLEVVRHRGRHEDLLRDPVAAHVAAALDRG